MVTKSNVGFWPFSEMEKRADSADISVLFFLIAVLIFSITSRSRSDSR